MQIKIVKSIFKRYRKANFIVIVGMIFSLISACSLKQDYVQPLPNDVAKAKNVILMIGDGMGISTITAMRIFAGQNKGLKGEEYVLPFEKFNNVALVKTYNTNQQVPDSAGTATAMNTGVKTKAGVIGVGPDALRGDCRALPKNRLRNFSELVMDKGYSIGIVTTAAITHATPAAVYAHSPDRSWESDADMTDEQRLLGCQDIASELLDFDFDIAFGGGRENFVLEQEGGKRLDKNILEDWENRHDRKYIVSKNDLDFITFNKQVLGLFADSHMTYQIDKTDDSLEPTLSEMSIAAIQYLEAKNKPYYLMIEGGRIDHGHHEGRAGYALSEGEAFADAVAKVVEMVDMNETLILVTADHSHVFTIAGYPTRGNPILGLVTGNDEQGIALSSPKLADDGIPYTTLGYINGPGIIDNQNRPIPETGLKARQQALYFYTSEDGNISETHGGEDVALFAQGPGSERVKGVIEQNKIFNIMKTAIGID